MTLDDLKRLPQFIDGSGDSMWPIEPGTVETAATRYVKLSDVLALLAPTAPPSPFEGFICVGPGGAALRHTARANNWELYSFADGAMTGGGWNALDPRRSYYIKRTAYA